MARKFAVNDKITFPVPAALVGVDGGPLTVAIVAKLDSSAYSCPIYTKTSGGSNAWSMEFDTVGGLHANYVTGTTNRPIGTVSTGAYFVAVLRKDSGGTFMPVGRFLTGASFATDSGNNTAVSTLVDGPALDSGGTIQVGLWGTIDWSTDLNVAGIAVWGSYLADASIPALTTWAAILAASPTYWIKLDSSNVADSASATPTVTGTTVTADPSGFFGGAGTAVNVTDAPPVGISWGTGADTGVSTGLAMPDSPSRWSVRSQAVDTVSFGVAATDGPATGLALGSGAETGTTAGTGVADSPSGLQFASSGAPSITSGVLVTDAPSGVRLGAPSATVGSAVTASDAPAGIRWSVAGESLASGLLLADSPGGTRWGSAQEIISYGLAVTDSPAAWRVGAPSGSALSGVLSGDLPSGWGLGSATETVAISGNVDSPAGWLWGSGSETVTAGTAGGSLIPTIFPTVSTLKASSGISTVSIATRVREVLV